jgi:hypothetical protein
MAKGPRVMLPIVDEEALAVQARWPDPVLSLSEDERAQRVRAGRDTVMLKEASGTRGFVRAVLRVPHDHPRAQVYGVFVEVDRAAYEKLKKAHADKRAVRVWGKLATKLPYLEDALGTDVEILEDGTDKRARIVSVESKLLRDGPTIGPMR